jgi:hypothetical protein
VGDETVRGASVTGIYRRLVEHLSRWLGSEDRDAVLGDVAESGVHGRRALQDVSGLVLRRQMTSLGHEFRLALRLVVGRNRYLSGGIVLGCRRHWHRRRVANPVADRPQVLSAG